MVNPTPKPALRELVSPVQRRLLLALINSAWNRVDLVQQPPGTAKANTLRALARNASIPKRIAEKQMRGLVDMGLVAFSTVCIRAGQKGFTYFVDEHAARKILYELYRD